MSELVASQSQNQLAERLLARDRQASSQTSAPNNDTASSWVDYATETAGNWASNAASGAQDSLFAAANDAQDWVANTASEGASGVAQTKSSAASWMSEAASDVAANGVDVNTLTTRAVEAGQGALQSFNTAKNWLSGKGGEATAGAHNTAEAAKKWGPNTLDQASQDFEGWHYDKRESLNSNVPSQADLANGKKGWDLLPSELSVLHDNGQGAPEEKWVHQDGREAVYDMGDGSSTPAVMTDPRYVGTYNYANASDSTLGHAALDVVPWLALGNTRDDPTTLGERADMLIPDPPSASEVVAAAQGKAAETAEKAKEWASNTLSKVLP